MKDASTCLQTFFTTYNSLLPPDVNKAFDDYWFWFLVYNAPDCVSSASRLQEMMYALFKLRSFLSEVEYYFSNTSEVIKRQSERAFLHLQQSIVAAEDVQQRWQKAFDKDEPACEKLGAAHLLLHGIYAFKANAEGARTDLVFPDRPFNMDDVQRTADGLVLTEWKKVKTQTEASTKAEQARRQAALYHSGILGGIELANYRYILLVSEEQLNFSFR